MVLSCCVDTGNSSQVVIKQLGANAFFKKFRLLDGTYETGKRGVCVFKSSFFRNAVNDFGYATFPQKGRADIFVYKI